jgi:hypothetical protein
MIELCVGELREGMKNSYQKKMKAEERMKREGEEEEEGVVGRVWGESSAAF